MSQRFQLGTLVYDKWATPSRQELAPTLVLVLIVVASAAAAIFAAFYVYGEDGVYIWDYRGYWDQYKQFGHYIAEGNLRMVIGILGDIRKAEYNVVPIIPLQLFSLSFPDSRTAYIVSIVLIYLIPSAFISAYFGTLICAFANATRPVPLRPALTPCFIILLIVSLTFPPYWLPSLRGFPDISGLIPLGLASILVISSEFDRRLSVRRAIVLGVLLWLCFLLRRWYAYTVVAFFIASYIYSFMANDRTEASLLTRLKFITTTYAVTSVVTLTCALLFQPMFILSILHTDYRDIYQFAQINGNDHIRSLLAVFGPVTLVLAFAGIVVGASGRATRAATVFVIINIVVLYAMFTHTQAFGPHHYLPLSFWILALCAFTIQSSIERTTNIAAVGVGVFIISMVIFWGVFFPLPGWTQQGIGWLLPQAKNYQLKFPARQEYDPLLRNMQRLTKGGDKVAAFDYGYDSFDDVISDELLSDLMGQQAKVWLVRGSHVDRRDLLQIEPLLARYVIVPDTLSPAPVEHSALPPWPPIWTSGAIQPVQQVEAAPAQSIRDGRGIGAAYKRLPVGYSVSNNVVHMFEKTRPFTLDEADELLEQFFSLYPEWREKYAFARVLLTADMSSLDPLWKFKLELPDELKIWPGETGPAGISIPYSTLKAARVRGLLISTHHEWRACSRQKSLAVNIKVAAAPIWQGTVSSADSVVNLAGQDGGAVSLEIGPAAKAGCEYLSVRPIF